MARIEFNGGTFLVPFRDLPEGREVRLRISARDVSLTLERQTGTSILNIFPAKVDRLQELDSGVVLVRLLVGGQPILSSISVRSSLGLGLKEGKDVFAQVKSAALLDQV